MQAQRYYKALNLKQKKFTHTKKINQETKAVEKDWAKLKKKKHVIISTGKTLCRTKQHRKKFGKSNPWWSET